MFGLLGRMTIRPVPVRQADYLRERLMIDRHPDSDDFGTIAAWENALR